ncbi:MAG: tRNA (adenosine(37)-N6)-threonylcarbamoyltransferase complex ATPase subunit type 1 TsaE [Patescibacteria group bacterium]|nr:tRNA (adenosine(37)-N6)-threonylcarbamoyltransferase complex ATPase subunit type 1 TsaE [Patescibacteria group bacterium]
MEIIVTKKQLPKVAQDIIKKIHKIKSETATVIALKGDLGSGKTTLTQVIAQKLGVKENTISPTFVIMKKYKILDKQFENLIHIDAYRLKESSELLNLGWQKLLADKSNLIIIEWPERVPECIPEGAYTIELHHKEENTRLLKSKD